LAPYRTAELKAIVMGIARQQERDVTPQAARVETPIAKRGIPPMRSAGGYDGGPEICETGRAVVHG
jgi:hypothetical protein